MSKRLGGIIGCKDKTSSWHLNGFPDGSRSTVVVVVDSHVQRSVLATEETTVTQQVSHRPIKCQSRLWSQRGTKVNGSHHGDIPLLRPTGIQIATKSYATLQAMASTNIKTVHQTSLLFIESNLDRLGLLSPTHDQRSQQQTGQIALQPVLIILKTTHCTKIRKIEIPRSMVVEALSWWSRRASQHPAVQSPVHPCKSPTNLSRSPLLVALVGRNKTVVKHHLSPQKPPGSSLLFSRTGVRFSPPLARQ